MISGFIRVRHQTIFEFLSQSFRKYQGEAYWDRHWDFLFPFGLLVYVGNAFGSGGLRDMISHHLRVNRKCHWHIDYLLQKMPVCQVLYSENPRRLELEWAMLLERILELSIPMKRFGASDCQCASHLFHIPFQYGEIQIEQKLKEDVMKISVL